jgi:hypothetical protein
MEMNIQIQKLLDQATYNVLGVKQIDQKQFAELLVKECASIAGKAEYSDTWTEPVEDTIKKHFGVEL